MLGRCFAFRLAEAGRFRTKRYFWIVVLPCKGTLGCSILASICKNKSVYRFISHHIIISQFIYATTCTYTCISSAMYFCINLDIFSMTLPHPLRQAQRFGSLTQDQRDGRSINNRMVVAGDVFFRIISHHRMMDAPTEWWHIENDDFLQCGSCGKWSAMIKKLLMDGICEEAVPSKATVRVSRVTALNPFWVHHKKRTYPPNRNSSGTFCLVVAHLNLLMLVFLTLNVIFWWLSDAELSWRSGTPIPSCLCSFYMVPLHGSTCILCPMVCARMPQACSVPHGILQYSLEIIS